MVEKLLFISGTASLRHHEQEEINDQVKKRFSK
jgi:hypothetical protein